MKTDSSSLVIAVRPGSRTETIMSWLRKLLPAAVLVVAATSLPARADVVIDEEEVVSGPLSLADALLRKRE